VLFDNYFLERGASGKVALVSGLGFFGTGINPSALHASASDCFSLKDVDPVNGFR
jgi:hypothetical protein